MSQIQTKFLADNAVTSAKIPSNAVTTAKVADDNITAAKIRLDNNTSLKGRNAADSANIDMFKVNASDVVEAGAELNMGANKIANLANPSAATDAVNLQTMQSYLAGLKPKQAVALATTANINLSSAPSTIDGLTPSNGDRILVKDQTTASQNGIYIFNGASNAMTRATDFDSLSPIDEINGAYTMVQDGTVNFGKAYVQQGVVVTLGTTDINFVFFNGSTTYVSEKETFTLSAGDITNQYLDLQQVAETDSVDMKVKGSPSLLEGASHDFSVNYTGGGGGVTRVTFLNDLATGGSAALIAGDVVQISYRFI
jgi:hypothetical protein